MEMLINAFEHQTPLPDNPVLLTFDDGYIDHYLTVFPMLMEHGIRGAFYPPIQAVTEGTILDVNKIHLILAAGRNVSDIISAIYGNLDAYRDRFNLESNQHYYQKLAKPNRFDTADVIFIKRLLQVELDKDLRSIITNNLFDEIVGVDQKVISKELYMNAAQLKLMHDSGMHIGSHGYAHYWLKSLPKEQQREEVSKGCDFLKSLGVDMDNWTMCYPYGAYDASLVGILREHNCKLGLTTVVDTVDLRTCDRFAVPRLDTNDFHGRR